MKKAKKLNIIIAVLLMAALILPAAAYFTADIIKGLKLGSLKNNGAVTVEAASFDELVLLSRDSTDLEKDGNTYTYTEFNGTGEHKSAVRRIIKLTNDITLSNNVVITADCHIDLSGYTLDIGDYSITFRHGYNGLTEIKGGTIKFSDTLDAPKIYKDTPNITDMTFSSVAFKKGDADYSGEKYVDITESDISLAYNALMLIAVRLADETVYFADQLPYDELSALADSFGEGSLFTSSLFYTPRVCSFKTAVTKEPCVLVSSNLDLPTTLEYANDVTIEYTSSNAAVIASDGSFTAPAEITDVTLTVAVKKGGTAIADTVFTLHAINPANVSHCNIGADFLFASFMGKYYTEKYDDTTDATTEVYKFDRASYLPKSFKFGSNTVELDYSLDVGEESLTVGSNALLDKGAEMLFTPPKSAETLTVTFGTAPVAVTRDYAIDSGVSMIIESNASIAKQFLKRVYGGNGDTIVVQAVNNGSSFDPEPLVPIDEIAESKGALSVEYSKIADNDGIYEIVKIDTTTYIRVAPGKDPATSVEPVIVECLFTFSGTDKKERLLCEVIATDGEDSDNVSGFLPYYTYYNSQFLRQTAGSVTSTFTMPFSYGIKATVCYDISVNTDGVWTENPTGTPITVSLVYNNTEHLMTIPAGKTSYVDALEAHLAANRTANESNASSAPETISDIIAYGDAQWKFTVDADAIPSSNINYRLHYNYKLSVNDTDWTRYQKDTDTGTTDGEGNPITELRDVVSEFVIPGILKRGIDVADNTLYKWMYETFSGRTDYAEGTSLVYTDWLKQDKPFDMVTDNALKSVTDLKGIEYLSGTQYLRIAPDTVTSSNAVTVMQYIIKMTSLRELVLTDNTFYDKMRPTLEYNGIFDGIENLTNLTTLYIDQNAIYSFDFLLNLPALEKAYISDNIVTEVIGDGNIEVDKIFYGSEGLTNYTVYQELQSNGVSVYNTATVSGQITIYKLFEDSSEVNDFMNLKSIEYQAKLEAGGDIRNIYMDFSTNPDHYNLTRAYGALAVTNQVLAWGHIGADGAFIQGAAESTTAVQFAVQYSLRVDGQEVVLLITYDVIRVGGGA